MTRKRLGKTSLFLVIRVVKEVWIMISIKVPKNQNRVALFELAKMKAKAAGTRLTGCVASGEFSGKGVAGTYITQGDFLNLTITKKPFYIPESAIKTKLEAFFS